MIPDELGQVTLSIFVCAFSTTPVASMDVIALQPFELWIVRHGDQMGVVSNPMSTDQLNLSVLPYMPAIGVNWG